MLTEILYNWGGANVWLFRIINAVHSIWWDRFMISGTWLTDNQNVAIFVALLLVVGAISSRRSVVTNNWFRISAILGMSFALTSVIVFVTKHAVAFPRPPQVLPEIVTVVLAPEDSFSFPSGHAALAAMLATAFWPCLPTLWRLAALLFVVWVALSRVALGAHFPADVVAGALIGTLVTWLTRLMVGRMRRPVIARGAVRLPPSVRR